MNVNAKQKFADFRSKMHKANICSVLTVIIQNTLEGKLTGWSELRYSLLYSLDIALKGEFGADPDLQNLRRELNDNQSSITHHALLGVIEWEAKLDRPFLSYMVVEDMQKGGPRYLGSNTLITTPPEIDVDLIRKNIFDHIQVKSSAKWHVNENGDYFAHGCGFEFQG